MIVMRLESVHATGSLGQAGREGKTDYYFHSVCVVGALELTSEPLLPLLDWSCQSCSAHVCVITTANTSSTAACSDEQTQTYAYTYMHTHKDTLNHTHACTQTRTCSKTPSHHRDGASEDASDQV